MTTAAAIFCGVIFLALWQGFGSPAFVPVIASDAISATMPFLGFLLVARYAASRLPGSLSTIDRAHVAAQALLVSAGFGWWWVEPHTLLKELTGGSLAAVIWQSLFGAVVGFAIARAAERARSPMVLREVGLAAWVLFVLGGGRLYRSFDHVEAGYRLESAACILLAVVVVAAAAYRLLRDRERTAAAIPALAPAVAAVALVVAMQSGGPEAESTRDSVLLLVVDTLRADIADGRFPSDSAAMPELARIAESGVRFTQAVSPAPWTLPAVVSTISGWNPHRHRFGVSVSPWEVLPGDPAALYLPAAMRDAGYLTGAFVNNPYLRPFYGFDAGFYTMRPYHGRGQDGVALALTWMQDHNDAPSFTMLHLMDPHWPYDAPPMFGAPREPCPECDSLFDLSYTATTPKIREEVVRRYAAEVHYTDALIGRLYDMLEESGALDRTWVIITADHGEEFWEHGHFLHGHALYDELLRVPLLIVPPRGSSPALAAPPRRGVRVDEQVRLEDVAATMLEIAGLGAELAPDGKSLLTQITTPAPLVERPVVAGYVKDPKNLSYAVRRPPWKATVSDQFFQVQLFDLAKDPGEKSNLLFRNEIPPLRRLFLGSTVKELAALPESEGLSVAREVPASADGVPDTDSHRALRSLGYAQ